MGQLPHHLADASGYLTLYGRHAVLKLGPEHQTVWCEAEVRQGSAETRKPKYPYGLLIQFPSSVNFGPRSAEAGCNETRHESQ
jgi:hypothetical protein